MQNQKSNQDFCRTVGGPHTYVSCFLSGADKNQQHTLPSFFMDYITANPSVAKSMAAYP